MKFLIRCSILVLILNSCQSENKEKLSFTSESFDTTIKFNEGIVLDINGSALGRPNNLVYHPKDYLICSDNISKQLLKVINVKTGGVQELINKGRGPKECIHIGSISIVNDDIWIYGRSLSKMLHLKLDSLGIFRIVDEFKISKQTSSCIALTNKLFAGTSFSEHRVSYYNRKGEFLYGTLDMPKEVSLKEEQLPNVVFQTSITKTPNGKNVVLANQFIDVLECYSNSGDTTFVLSGPDGFKTSLKPRSNGGARSFPLYPQCFAYIQVAATDNEIWGSYIGIMLQKGSAPLGKNGFPNRIFCFTTEGEPKRKIKFDDRFISFAVDSKNAKLFCLMHEPDIRIVQYNINGLIN